DFALLLDLGGALALALAQVVQLRAADLALGEDLDLVDHRAVDREGARDPDAEAELADGEGLADARAVAADDDALEDLDTRAGAFLNAHVHADGVAGTEVGHVGPHGSSVQLIQNVHGLQPRRITVLRSFHRERYRLNGRHITATSLLCHMHVGQIDAGPAQ